MTQPINFVHQDKISLHLLKSEIDRRINLILQLLNHKASITPFSHSHHQPLPNASPQMGAQMQKAMEQDASIGGECEDSEKEMSKQSDSRKEIEKQQNKNLDSLEQITEDFLNKVPLELNLEGKTFRIPLKTTDRHKKRNKQNKNIGSPSQKKTQKISSKKTPLPSNFYNSKTTSAVKKHSLNHTHTEERTTVTEKTLELMRHQLQLHDGQRKRYSHNNNVRFNMLRRIEAMSEQIKQSNRQ